MPTHLKRLMLRQVPSDLHKSLKVLAAKKGIPLYRLIVDMLYEAIRKEGER